MRRGRQHHRSRKTEMCEEHLAEVLVDRAPRRILDRERHVLQRKPLHASAIAVGRFERHKRGEERSHAVSQRLGQTVAAPVRARPRIGKPSRRQNDAPRGIVAAAARNGKAVRRRHDRLHVTAHPHSSAHRGRKRVHHVGGAVGDGKDARAALGLQGNAQRLKVRHGVGGREARHRRMEKARIFGHAPQKFVHGAVVRQVAAPLTRNAQLAPRALVLLKYRDLGALGKGGRRRHHARCPRADHGDALRAWHRRRTHPTVAPCAQSAP